MSRSKYVLRCSNRSFFDTFLCRLFIWLRDKIRCSLFFIFKPMYVGTISKEEKESIFNTKAYVCSFNLNPLWGTNDKSFLTTATRVLSTTTTQPTTHNTQQTPPPWSPRPPASNGSNFRGECNCPTSYDGSWSTQHSNVVFLMQNLVLP